MSNATTRLYPYGYGNPAAPALAPQSLPHTPYYDLSTRTLFTDSTGAYIGKMHPVDQAVAIILGGPKGYIGSSPLIGIDYDLIVGQPQSRWQAIIDADARRALDSGIVKYLAQGLVTMDPLVLVTNAGAPWSVTWTATYSNNRLPNSNQKTISGGSV